MATKARFLLVEDDDDHAELVQFGFSAHESCSHLERVGSGEAALAFLEKEQPYTDRGRPDVILLDLNLPGMSGLEVLSVIKSTAEWRAIPVVVLTTSGSETDRARAYGRHANSYVIKPVEFARMEALVQELVHYWTRCNQRLSTNLAEAAETIDPSDTEQLVRDLEHESAHLQLLIDKALQLSAGVMPSPQSQLVDLDAVVDAAIDQLLEPITASRASIHRSPLPSVQGLRPELELLMFHLLDNALKFVRGRVPEIWVSAERREGECVVRVRDNGIGIAEANHQRIFDLQVRAESGDEFEGAGLGLTACRRIVEQHRGRIWVESSPGCGSVFCFAIPR